MARRRPRYSGTHPRRFEQRYKELAPEQHAEHTSHLRDKGRAPVGTHVPVLLAEVVEWLAPKPGEVLVDATLGFGGHARELLKRLLPGGRLIGLDQDSEELEKTRARLTDFGDALHVHAVRFAGIPKVVAAEGRTAVDGILADLGVSSMQLDDPARGFSLKQAGPLDLRMDPRRGKTGAELVNTLAESELAGLLRDLADEAAADAIAREIVVTRTRKPFALTSELVDAVFRAKGLSRRQWREQAAGAGHALHPAALAFQALRIRVNDELAQLRELLRVAPLLLQPGGRLAVISFHSGEDRIVKESFARGSAAGVYRRVSDEPLRATAEEVHFNSRAASAKLRGAVKA